MVRSVVVASLVLLVAACSGGSSSAPRVRASARTTVTAAPSTTVRPRPTTTTLHPITGTVNAIGDSVMIDAASALRAEIPTIQIDAAVSRSAIPGPSILGSLAASGRLGPSIVFGLVANGGVSTDRLNQVLTIAQGRRVVMVTGHCPSCRDLAAQNAIIRATCTRARHCLVADFDAVANKHPDWFASDGVHMGSAGARMYARLIRSKL